MSQAPVVPSTTPARITDRPRSGIADPPGPRTVHRLGADGVILDWLLSPVWDAPCDELGEIVAADGEPWDDGERLGRWRLTNGPDVAPVKDLLYAAHPATHVAAQSDWPHPVGGAPIAWPSPFPTGPRRLEGAWARHRTAADGVIERSVFCYTPTYRTFLATTRIEVDQPEVRLLRIASTGPVRVWLDGRLILDHAEFGYMVSWTRDVEVLLPSGTSDLLLQSWNVALREVRQVVRVQVVGLPVRVTLAGDGADEVRSAQAEQLLDAVTVRRWEVDADHAVLHGPPGLRLRVAVNGIALSPVTIGDDGRARIPVVTTDSDSHQASMLGTGELTLTVGVDDDGCPVTRDLLVGYLPWRTRRTPEGGQQAWRTELLEHVAGRGGSAASLARYALDPDGDGTAVRADDLAAALRFITTRCDCADFEAVGLMLLWHRVPEARWEPQVRQAVREALLGFKYWIDQPGIDAMCYFTENHQMVWHTAETLVGEAFSDETFTNAGWTGTQHADHGRTRARAWIERKLTSGFSEFDSNAYLAIDALALVALVDHAQDDDLRTAAETLLDKILLTLATNSWRGIHGTAHGRSYTPTLRASCLEETAPIMWQAWGVGGLNEATLPATALATATAYVMPEVIRAIGQSSDVDWGGEQTYCGSYGFERDLLVRPYHSRVLVRRGPGGMMSSVQDYRSGLPGLQEHIWGITLPGQIQVWATNPAAANHGSHTRPSSWVGHRVLPRARQHERTLIALHPLVDGAAGTHLWFPVDRLDEWEQHGDWLIGRAGAGLVAVGCAGGWQPETVGDEAWQRWLPRGDGGAIVALHRDTRDHAHLAALRESLPALAFRAAATPGVQVTGDLGGGAGGQTLELAWEGPLLVDGRPVDIADGTPRPTPHLANPACVVEAFDDDVVVEWEGHRMHLDPRAGRRLHPPSAIRQG